MLIPSNVLKRREFCLNCCQRLIETKRSEGSDIDDPTAWRYRMAGTGTESNTPRERCKARFQVCAQFLARLRLAYTPPRLASYGRFRWLRHPKCYSMDCISPKDRDGVMGRF